MYCSKCQIIIEEDIKYCPKCHSLLNRVEFDPTTKNLKRTNSDIEKENPALFFITLMMPYFGILFYFILRDRAPKNAKYIIKALRIYLVILVLLGIIIMKMKWSS